jgi:hypothetical protein
MRVVVLVMMCVIGIVSSAVYAYTENDQDKVWRLAIQARVDQRWRDGQFDRMQGAVDSMNRYLTRDIDTQTEYHLTWARLYTTRKIKTIPNDTTAMSPRDFWSTYAQHVTSWWKRWDDPVILDSCLQRRDIVDAIAKQENFPTALVMATWRKESSCRVVNPSNRDGLFQILSIDYPPGPVYKKSDLKRTTLGDKQWRVYAPDGAIPAGASFVDRGNILEEQVMDFIKFSRNKRAYSDRLKVFDAIPISLSYDAIDLLSLRKHAIAYNGFVKGRHPENAFYANQNLWRDYEEKQDGLVTLLLKVLDGVYKE